MPTIKNQDEARRLLLPGSLLWRKDLHIGLVDHYGVLLQSNPPLIAHIEKVPSTDSAYEGYLRPKVESFEVFAAGRAVMAEAISHAVPLDQMWPRVQEVASAKRLFGFFTFDNDWNCESFARYVRDGSARSLQAEDGKGWLMVLGVIGFVTLVARSGPTEHSGTAEQPAVRRSRR